jgi:CDP-diacylglycerol--glycerol-3-phosphate 3-phosphatidyltransferase
MLNLQIPDEEKRIFTISNLITLSRLAILPFVLYLIRAPRSATGDLLLFLLVAWGIVSDFLDGYIARKRGEVSLAGKIIDPLVDKICVGSAVIFASLYRGFPFWLAVVIIARDVIILLASLVIMSRKKIVTVSNIYGKVTVTVFALLIASYLFGIEPAQKPLTVLAVLGIFVSAFTYLKGFILTMRAG